MALYTNEEKAKIITNVATSAGLNDRLGTLTADTDLRAWASPMFTQPRIFNQFITTLLEQFVYKATKTNIFKSAFDVFREKRDGVGRGTYETVVNPILPLDYDMTAFDRVLKFYPTDVKAQYFAINRRQVFGQTMVRNEVEKIFASWNDFDNFLEELILAIPNGNVLIENSYCKELLNTNIASGAIKSITYNRPTTKEEWYALAQQIQSIALGMCAEPSSDYNNYANLEGSDGNPVYTQSRRDDLVFIGDKDIISGIKTYVLTTAFQEEHVDFKFKFVVLNDTGYREYNAKTQEFGEYHSGLFDLIICDGGALKLEDNYREDLEDYNIFTRGLQRAVHIDQTYAIRAFRNMVAFVQPSAVLESLNADTELINLNDDTTSAVVTMSTIPTDYEASYVATAIEQNIILVDNNNVYSFDTDVSKFINNLISPIDVNDNTITLSLNEDTDINFNDMQSLIPESANFTISPDTLLHIDYIFKITDTGSNRSINIPLKVDINPFSATV